MPDYVFIDDGDTTLGLFDADGKIRVTKDDTSRTSGLYAANGSFRVAEVASAAFGTYGADGALNYYLESDNAKFIGGLLGGLNATSAPTAGGLNLDDWSSIWTAFATTEMVTDADAPSGEAIRVVNSAATAHHALVWNTPGDITGPVELLLMTKQVNDPAGAAGERTAGPILCASGTSGSPVGWAYARGYNLSALKSRMYLGAVGGMTTISASWTTAPTEIVFYRLRWDGTNLTIKYWLSTVAEPGAAQHSITNGPGSNSGKLGFYGRLADLEYKILYAAYSTDGSVVPLP